MEGFNQNDYRMTYNVDIALCIDVTGSMRPILDTVKNNALNLCDDIKNTMIRKGKEINKLRIRIVAFRDYDADGDEAMLVTDFFNMPEQGAIFEKCVRGLKPKGGGDIPEDGLEALAYGIKSKRMNSDTEDQIRATRAIWLQTLTSLPSGGEIRSFPESWIRMRRDSSYSLRNHTGGAMCLTAGIRSFISRPRQARDLKKLIMIRS